jgi:hypothetical protein
MRKVLQQFLFLATVTLLAISCEKGEEPFPSQTSQAKTIIKLPDAETGPMKTIALDLTPGVVSIKVLEIRRDAASAAELNKTHIVKIRHQNALISDPTSGAVVELPRNLYTVDPSNPFDGQYWTVTFDPGEFVEFIKINLNPSNLITAGRVGLGFLLAETPGAQINDEKSKLGVEISAKNQWDGRYRLTWTNYHPTLNPGYTGAATDVEMHTTGPNTVKIFWPLAGVFACPSILSGGLSYFGIQEPQYTISTATNAVTVQNVAPGAVTFYTMATGFNSRYEPGTKTFFAKWGYSYASPGVFDAGCREWTQQMVYLGPR